MSSRALNFLETHQNLVSQLKTKYGDTLSVPGSENEMVLGRFPALGCFLGVPDHSREMGSFLLMGGAYILCCFDLLDNDSPTDLGEKQRSTFETLVTVIEEQGFQIITEIEPATTIATGEGSFITGWTTMIYLKT